MTRPAVSLSNAEARRMALAATGLAGPRSAATVGLVQLRTLAGRLHQFQIDAVNVLVRAQYLPAFSRLGPYPLAALDRLAYDRHELFEYSGHAESLIDVRLHPFLRWRFDEPMRWSSYFPRDYVEKVLAEVAEHGPLTPTELTDPGRRPTQPGSKSVAMWGRSPGKRTLEWLRGRGILTVAGRRGIEQTYDLTERVIPRAILDAPTPDRDVARRHLLTLSAKALGVGTAKDIADYFRIRHAAPLLKDLVADGVLLPTQVEGWTRPAFVYAAAPTPRQVDGRALVSPFDPLVWERGRTERLFGFRYRIEIYNRPEDRVHGYYVLPFLLGDALVARVDLKADRRQRALLVQSAWVEAGCNPRVVAAELAAELRLMAEWLALDRVEVVKRGDLATALGRSLKLPAQRAARAPG